VPVVAGQDHNKSPGCGDGHYGVQLAYQFLGLLAVALAIVGIILPLLPTVPFLLLAAFFFARSHPEWERKILEHARFGSPSRHGVNVEQSA
jgi:uncharacterized membrane protein YbaN (DUF454 family)